MRKFSAILIGKLILLLTRALKVGGGSAAPGLYALRIYPNLVSDLASKIPQSIVITGTNGKTTTARLLAHFAQAQGLKVLKNSTGSNLERGIASALIHAGDLSKYDLAIWELDEAAFNQVVPKVNPNFIVFLNVFRDQLDRYGEVDNVTRKWQEVLKKISSKTTLLLNGDDDNLLELKKSFKGKVITFGVENYKIRGENSFKKIGEEKLDLEANNVLLIGLDGVRFELKEKDGTWNFSLPLPGIYHIYDFLAAYTSALSLGIERDKIIKSLQNFSPAFGRVEKFQVTVSQEGYILLIKNPTGATQVFETLKGELKPNDRLLIALNDNFADGKDVSWIWDAEFEMLKAENLKLKAICSGTRAEDLAVRLKYAGFEIEDIEVENNLKKALERAKEGLKGLPAGRQGRLFILPTYTALLELQKILASTGVKNHYWEEK